MLITHQLNVRYPGQTDYALKDINLTLKKPTITGIIGPNGAGKSTLMKAILQLISYEGTIQVDGKHPKHQLAKFAYVEQKNQFDLTFPITVKECVSLGLYPNINLLRLLSRDDWEHVKSSLIALNIHDLENQSLGSLSGGQLQRVLIARCLVQDAPYIFLDEPFVGIDNVSEAVIIQVLHQLKNQGKHIFIIHHDLKTVEKYFDHVILINRTLIAEGKTQDVFTPKNLQATFQTDDVKSEVVI